MQQCSIKGELTTPEKYYSDIPLTDEDLHSKIILHERQIVNSPVENVLVFDECGNILIHFIGDRSNVQLPAKYWNDGKVITHNHPDGATLSAEDVSRLYATPVNEIRACSGGVWYSAKRGENTAARNPYAVKSELSDHLLKNEEITIRDICEMNGIYADININKGTCKAVKPWAMSSGEFERMKDKSIKEVGILRILRLHQALEDYCNKNGIIYTFGDLEA